MALCLSLIYILYAIKNFGLELCMSNNNNNNKERLISFSSLKIEESKSFNFIIAYNNCYSTTSSTWEEGLTESFPFEDEFVFNYDSTLSSFHFVQNVYNYLLFLIRLLYGWRTWRDVHIYRTQKKVLQDRTLFKCPI